MPYENIHTNAYKREKQFLKKHCKKRADTKLFFRHMFFYAVDQPFYVISFKPSWHFEILGPYIDAYFLSLQFEYLYEDIMIKSTTVLWLPKCHLKIKQLSLTFIASI